MDSVTTYGQLPMYSRFRFPAVEFLRSVPSNPYVKVSHRCYIDDPPKHHDDGQRIRYEVGSVKVEVMKID